MPLNVQNPTMPPQGSCQLLLSHVANFSTFKVARDHMSFNEWNGEWLVSIKISMTNLTMPPPTHYKYYNTNTTTNVDWYVDK